MIRLHEKRYEYFEEANQGILAQMPTYNGAEPRSVLDVGCGRGALSHAIKQKGYTVYGIEENNEAALKAKARIDAVVVADLTKVQEIEKALLGRRFDMLVFSDVLEHLYDPFTVLKQYIGFLKQGGLVLVSVPNAVVWTRRISVLFGNFEYSDTGVMDRTHVRFFTFATAKRLVAAAGCTVIRTDYTPFVARAFLPLIKKLYLKGGKVGKDRGQVMNSPIYKAYMKFMYPVEYWTFSWWKRMFAFRIIIVGRKR